MQNQFSRTELLLGEPSTEILSQCHVAIFGIGGVGCAVVEALARAGIGKLTLVDNDTFSETNLNRQLFATHKTINRAKVDVAKERITEINPACQVIPYKAFYLPEKEALFDFAQYDYIADAIDTISGKIGLITAAQKVDVPIISAMGAGNKLTPQSFEVADIYQTSVCPLAHVMRKELKKRGIKNLKVVYSKEKALSPLPSDEQTLKRSLPGSTPFVPPVVGFIMAAEIIKDLLKIKA